jgi:hypothetical protein
MKIHHKGDYVKRRKEEYPDLAELADAMYWQSKGDRTKLEAYLAKCEQVKTKFPKPKK